MSKENFVFGIHTVESLLQNSPSSIRKLLLQTDRHDKRIQTIIDLAKRNNILIEHRSRTELDDLLDNATHQGVVAIEGMQKRISEKDISEILADIENPFVLILDGVQDPHNLGACLRTANAAGVHLVIAPKDRSVGLTDVVRKVACGAAEVTPFIQVTNLARTIKALKDLGIWIYGADGDADKNLHEADFKGPIALVLGAEGAGLRRLTRESCDILFSIPMSGSVESLNVSVATGIFLFEVVRQR